MSFFLLHGSDYFRLNRSYRSLLGRLRLGPNDITTFDGSYRPPSLTDLYQTAFSASLFGPANAVVLQNTASWMKSTFRGTSKKTLDAADLATLHDLTHAPEDVTVIFSEYSGLLPKTPQAVWKEISHGVGDRLIEINTLKFIPFAANPELESLIGKLAGENDLKLSVEAIRALAWRCGSDLGLIWAELGKYADWAAAHPQETVTPELIERETVPVVDVYIFDLIDAIAARQLKRALTLMHLVLQGGEPAAKVIVLIHRQYKLMFWALLAQGQGDLNRRLGVAPWQLRKLNEAGRSYSRGHVPRVLRLLVEADHAIKTSRLPADLALEVLVTRLCTI